MFDRLIKLPKKYSFFLFGARGTGKTTLLNYLYKLEPKPPKDVCFFNLLDPDQEELLLRKPGYLQEVLDERYDELTTVIIDEIQKVPALLDVIHLCMEKYKNIQFVMTGSSARKLKHGGANLLAGRAFSFNLYPMSSLELPDSMQLRELLSWGSLPRVFEFTSEKDRQRFLKTYSQTYLKQEVQLEHLVRNIVSFREFLDFAAQSSGEIINYRNIANRSGVDEKTVARYFEILIDTLIGFFLEPFNESVRVRQSEKPKFYLFDTGIQRYLSQTSDVLLKEQSSEYGVLFEQWVISEFLKLNEYFERDFRFYYLRTKDGAEIDLIVRKPSNKKILIEIKSTNRVMASHLSHLISLGKDIEHEEKWIVCNEPQARQTQEGVRVLPWKIALRKLYDR